MCVAKMPGANLTSSKDRKYTVSAQIGSEYLINAVRARSILTQCTHRVNYEHFPTPFSKTKQLSVGKTFRNITEDDSPTKWNNDLYSCIWSQGIHDFTSMCNVWL